MTATVDLAAKVRCQLGETPLWDSRRGYLTWIDVERRTHFTLDLSSGAVLAAARDTKYLGSQALTRSGGYLLMQDRTIMACRSPEEPGTVHATITGEVGLDTRLNDGRVDASGRLWIGTMDNGLAHPLGSLYRVDPDGSVTGSFGEVIVSNSIAFAPDGRSMSFSDTRRYLTWRIALESDDGMPTRRTVLHDWRARRERPDGACYDVDGCIWLALFGGGRVVRLTPAGVIDREIPVPVTNPTCCVFGGPDLRTLFVTTAAKFLNPAELAAEPLAGSLLAIEGAGQGLPEHRFDI
jgi:sugar lactone lactonase YvrE